MLQESEGRRACTIGLFRESNIAWCVAARACVRSGSSSSDVMNVVRPTARSVVEGGARGEPRCSRAAHMGRRGAGGVRARKNARAQRSGAECSACAVEGVGQAPRGGEKVCACVSVVDECVRWVGVL